MERLEQAKVTDEGSKHDKSIEGVEQTEVIDKASVKKEGEQFEACLGGVVMPITKVTNP